MVTVLRRKTGSNIFFTSVFECKGLDYTLPLASHLSLTMFPSDCFVFPNLQTEKLKLRSSFTQDHTICCSQILQLKLHLYDFEARAFSTVVFKCWRKARRSLDILNRPWKNSMVAIPKKLICMALR